MTTPTNSPKGRKQEEIETARKIVAGLIQGQDEDVKIALLMKLEKQAVQRFIETAFRTFKEAKKIDKDGSMNVNDLLSAIEKYLQDEIKTLYPSEE